MYALGGSIEFTFAVADKTNLRLSTGNNNGNTVTMWTYFNPLLEQIVESLVQKEYSEEY